MKHGHQKFELQFGCSFENVGMHSGFDFHNSGALDSSPDFGLLIAWHNGCLAFSSNKPNPNAMSVEIVCM